MTRYPKGGYRRRATSRWILPVGVLLFTLALRLVWVSDAGYVADVDFFVPWMRLAAQGGIRHVLAVAKTSYPPLSVYLLWILGLFSRSGALDGSPALVELLALRAAIVFFDVLMVAVLYRLGRRVAGRRRPANFRVALVGITASDDRRSRVGSDRGCACRSTLGYRASY